MIERKGKRFVDPQEKFVVHEDMLDFFRNYQQGKSFQEQVGEKRDEKLKNGEPFHNPDHDEEMKETARNRTDNATCTGWVFPGRRKMS
jgi:hypothetical protein